jgi:hypothetical protein
MPQRHAKFLKVGLGQLGQNISVDFVRAERGFVLTKTKVPQPTSEVHDGALTPPGAYDSSRPNSASRAKGRATLTAWAAARSAGPQAYRRVRTPRSGRCIAQASRQRAARG